MNKPQIPIDTTTGLQSGMPVFSGKSDDHMIELPELPSSRLRLEVAINAQGERLDYTESQMRAYGKACAQAALEAAANVSEAYEPRCDVCPSGVANAIRAMKVKL